MKSKKTDEIFFLFNKEVEPLPIREMKEGLFGTNLEDAFQLLLEKYPEIIPGKQIQPGADDPPRFVLIKREAPIGGWSLDHLLVDQHGVLTLVECKLLQNPESRRDVIGQIIEYAANAAAAWGGGQLRDLANSYWSRHDKNFEEICRSILGIDEEMEEFWTRIEANLEQGKIRLIITGDAIRPEVRRMIEYLNYEMEHVEVLGLELKCYGADEQKLVMVPSIIGQSLASVDRRKLSSQRWTPKEVEEGFRNADDKAAIDAFLTVLNWAVEAERYIVSQGKYPGMGVGNKVGERVLGIHQKGGAWGYFNEERFASTEKRDFFVDQLKQAGMLVETFDPDQEKNKRLDLTGENAGERLISILAKLDT